MFKNTASQKITMFAFDSATGLPKTGDAANITVYVSKDDGAVTVLGDTTATEADATNAKGDYLFDLTQTETNADKLRFTGKSSTSGIVVVPQTIYTLPTTGILAPTTAGRTLDVSAGGEAGVDWANVGSPTTTLALTGTTIATTQKVDLETIKTQAVATTGAGTITVPAAATLASTTNITAGTITTTTNLTNLPSITANWITAAGIADGAIDRATFAADTGLQTTRSNTAQAGGATSITLDASASATTDYYINQLVYITGGTGVGQSKFITAYNGTSKVATVNSAWATNPDNTSTFAIIPFDAIPGATAPTAAAVADAVWDEARSGHVSAGSFGEYVLADTIALSGDATAANNAESFFDGTGYAGTNNVIPTVTTLTNLPAITTNWLTAAGLATDAVAEIQSGLSTLDAAGVRTAVGLAAANLDTQLTSIDDYLDTEVAAIKAKTDLIPAAGPADAAVYTSTRAGYLDELAAANIPADIDQVKADLPSRITKNTALANFEFLMLLASDHITGATGKTITATRSIDGGAFASCTNSATEVSNGLYKIDLAAADLNGNVVTLRFTATACDDRFITIVTQP